MFGKGDFLTTEIGQGQVCYTEVKCHVPESTPEPAAMPDEPEVGCRVPALWMAFPRSFRFLLSALSPAQADTQVGGGVTSLEQQSDVALYIRGSQFRHAGADVAHPHPDTVSQARQSSGSLRQIRSASCREIEWNLV